MSAEKPTYYAILEAPVRYDKSLSDKAKLLHAEITALSNKSGFCSAGNQYFANLYGVAPQSISRLISQLQKAGHVQVKINQEKGNQRRIYLSTKTLIGVETESLRGINKNVKTPINKNVKHNITSSNTKINTHKKGAGEGDDLLIDWEQIQLPDVLQTDDFKAAWRDYELARAAGVIVKPIARQKLIEKLWRLNDGKVAALLGALQQMTEQGWNTATEFDPDYGKRRTQGNGTAPAPTRVSIAKPTTDY